MKKRSDSRSPLEVEEVGSSSNKGLVEIESVVEVDSVSNAVSLMIEVDSVSSSISQLEAQAAEAPSRLDFEQFDSRSRLEVKSISRGASLSELRAALH